MSGIKRRGGRRRNDREWFHRCNPNGNPDLNIREPQLNSITLREVGKVPPPVQGTGVVRSGRGRKGERGVTVGGLRVVYSDIVDD